MQALVDLDCSIDQVLDLVWSLVMASQANIHDAKTHFSRLIQRALAGEEIVIARAGKPVVRLVPVESGGLHGREPGAATGAVRMEPDFDAPLPPELQRHFEA